MLKNKRVGKKIRNIIILLMIIAIMIGAYQNIDRSRAEKVVEVSATALDNYGYLENEEFKLEANQIEDNSYEIQIPECVNNKKISQVIKASIDETNLEIVDNKIYLTKEQLESKNIEIELKYDVAILEPSANNTYNRILLSEKNDEEIKQIELSDTSKTLYYKILKYEDETNGKLVELKGYLPVNAELQVEEVSQEQLNQIFEDKEIKVAYDIKILDKVISEGPVDEANPDAEPEKIVETVEINPEDFGVTCEVTISDANISEKSQVYHVKDDNTYEKMNIKENTEGNISFEARSFSVYAVGDDVIDPDPGEDLGSHQYQTRVNYKTSSGKRGSFGAKDDGQWHTIKVPYGGYVEITNNTHLSDGMCICPGGGNCQDIHVDSYTLYPGYYGVYGYSSSGHTQGIYNLYITVEESVPPRVTVSTTSCGWRNSALGLSISVSSSVGLSSGNSYQYYLSTSSTALSGGSWIGYSRGASFNINPSSGTYYIFVKRVTDTDGAVSISNGTDVNVGGTTYHRFGPYRFDKIVPTVSNSVTSCSWRNSGLNTTITTTDTGGSELSSSNSYQYYLSNNSTALSGGSWANYTSGNAVSLNPGVSGTYYLFIKRASDNAGNMSTSNGSDVSVSGTIYHRYGPYLFDYDAPIITANPPSCTWRNSELDISLTISETGGSGLALNNVYEYYFSNSEDTLSGGEWITYNSEDTIKMNPPTSGVYYLFVKNIYDNTGNVSKSNGSDKTINSTDYQMFGEYQFDYESPEWEIQNLDIDKENDSLTVDIVGKDNLSGIETYLLTANDIVVYVDGTRVDTLTKKLSTATETDEGVVYQLALSNFEEDTKQSGKKYKEWSGDVTLEIAKDTLVDRASNKNIKQTLSLGQVDTLKPVFEYVYSEGNINYVSKSLKVVFSVTDKYFDTTNLNVEDLAILVDNEEPNWETVKREFTSITDITDIVNGVEKVVGKEYTLEISGLEQKYIEEGDKYLNYSGIVTILIPEGKILDTSDNGNNAQTITVGVNIQIQTQEVYASPSQIFDSTGTNANALHIGDFIEYDAGTWTQEEINAIQTGEVGNLVTANGSEELPTENYQFGGFKDGTSRNGNVRPSEWSGVTYDYVKEKTSDGTNKNITGWRVFDINDDGTVTLISAGNPESIYAAWNEAFQVEYILTGQIDERWDDTMSMNPSMLDPSEIAIRKNWEVYVNPTQHAQSATPLTMSSLNNWYSKYVEQTESLFDDTEIFQKIYQEPYFKYQNIVDNYSFYWLCEAQDQFSNFVTWVEEREISANCSDAYGIRMLVTLSSDVLISKTGTKTLTGGNMNTYGGEQTYNVWNIKQGENDTEQEVSSDPVIVDVVDPAFEIESSQVDIEGTLNSGISKATLIITGTDKYLKDATLRSAETLKVLVNGEEKTEGITKTLGEISDLTEERIIDGVSTTVKYGEKYTITVTGFPKDANQVKIQIPSGVLTDDSGNKNKVTYLVLYNLLRPATNETEATSPFLGESLETTVYPKGQSTVNPIARQDIEKIEFTEDLDGSKVEGVKRIWDVSAQGDETILAWTLQDTAPYTIYIGSETSIYANPDSSYLFSYIGYSDKCTSTETICNLDKLRLYFATNMEAMFSNFGYRSMTSLDLGDNFSTSKITNMANMFNNCGNQKMTSLKLGNNFDTSNVTNMSGMFNSCGYTLLKSLDLGDKFKTSNVLDMTNMFSNCGHLSMTTLDLGPMFTQIAYKHEGFAQNCGTSEIVVYAPETIYLSNTWFKINKKAK